MIKIIELPDPHTATLIIVSGNEKRALFAMMHDYHGAYKSSPLMKAIKQELGDLWEKAKLCSRNMDWYSEKSRDLEESPF